MCDSFVVGTRLVNVNHHCTPGEPNPVVHRVGFPPSGAQVIPATILGLFVNATSERFPTMCLTFVAGEMKDAGRAWKRWKRSVTSSELFVFRMCVKYMHARIFWPSLTDSSGFQSNFRICSKSLQKCEKRILREIFQSEFD